MVLCGMWEQGATLRLSQKDAAANRSKASWSREQDRQSSQSGSPESPSGAVGGFVSVYQRHDYAEEENRSLDDWASFVGDPVSEKSDNVVSISEVKPSDVWSEVSNTYQAERENDPELKVAHEALIRDGAESQWIHS